MLNFLAASYGSLSDIELLWTLIAIFGFVFSAFNFWNANEDIKALKNLRLSTGLLDPRMRVAIVARRNEAARMFIQAVFATIGIFAMTMPETPAEILPTKILIFRFIFTWGFIISGILLGLKSYWGYQLRREIIGTEVEQAKQDSKNPQTDSSS